MWLVAGLGNPGTKHLLTRHNVGFMAIDSYLNSIGNPPEKKEHRSLTYSFTVEGEKILMVKPQTFMNHSGEAIQALYHYYKIDPCHLIVLHDEIEQTFKRIKVQRGRGHGGHNGVRDIHEKLKTNDYYRIRIGVGRPEGSQEVVGYVLSSFSKQEREDLPDILEKVSDAVEGIVFDGLEKTASLLNRKEQ